MKLSVIPFTKPFIAASSLFVLGLEHNFQSITSHPSQLELLEGSSLATEDHLSDSSGIINYCHSSSDIEQTPYSEFFTATYSVSTFGKNLKIRQLAHKIISLKESLIPFEPWELFFHRNQLLVTECLQLAVKALAPTHDLDESERLWAVGIVAALSLLDNHDRTISDRSVDFYDLSPQVYLEIQATQMFEPFMTANFRSIWFDGKQLPVDDPELKECLKRAELFGQLMHGRSQEILEKTIPNELLKIQLPKSKVELEKVLNKFWNNFKAGRASNWKGNLLVPLLEHIIEHSSQIRATIQKQIQNYKFLKDINLPYAQQDLSNMLEDTSITVAIQTIHNSLSCVARGMSLDQHTSHSSVDTILNELAKGESAYTKQQIQLAHQALLAFCFIEPSAEEYLVSNFIEKEANVPTYLIRVWLEKENMEYAAINSIGNYSRLFFIRNPSYLKDARRQLSAQNMLQSKSKSLQEMGSFLESLPCIPGKYKAMDHRLGNPILKEYENVSIALQRILLSPSSEPHIEMCFEFLFHLTEYDEACTTRLLDKISSSPIFWTTVRSGANEVLKRNLSSWKQAPESYHVRKDKIHAFLKRLLLFCDQLWQETAPYNGHQPAVIKDPNWLSQDKKVAIELFGQTFYIHEVSTSLGNKRPLHVLEEGASTSLLGGGRKAPKW